MKWLQYILLVYLGLSFLVVRYVMCRGSKSKRLVNHGRQVTYEEAKEVCKSKGQSLPTVDDLEEIAESTPSSNAIWILPNGITRECRKDYITCDENRCVSPTQVCDAVDHCLDGSDEKGCNSPNPNGRDLDSGLSDCYDLFLTGAKTSGVYTIYPPLSPGIKVYCDMDSNGGGWTVFVNRLNQTTQENFNRPWEQYKEGFGNAANEYWMGNEALYAMTNSRDYTLRVDASIKSKGLTTWGEWAHFKVKSEDDKYKLSVSGYETSSSLKDSTITNLNGMYFTTQDRDNDMRDGGNCVVSYGGEGGGFWFNDCSEIRPTSPYSNMWLIWSKTDSSWKYPSHIQMKIRPKEK